MAVSAFGFLVATLIATPSIYVAMARQRLFFAITGRLHPRTGAPIPALVLQALICFVYLSWSGDVKSDLGKAVVFAEWIFHGLAAVALLRLVRKGRTRPFKSPLYPLFPVLYLLIAAGVVLGNLATTEARITLLGLGVLALGGMVYWLWAPKNSTTSQ
jgi:APA family basic amino acid/polyamine antiporter